MAFDIALVDGAGKNLPAGLVKLVQEICNTEGIPASGITMLGGKPYINVTGLDNKIRRRAEKENIVFAGVEIEDRGTVGEGPNLRREFRATVVYFDRDGFLEAINAIGSSADANAIKDLRGAFTHRYTDIGSCSPASVSMGTMKNADNVTMLASRRASNRAKRAATGVGLTSIDEVSSAPVGPDSNLRSAVVVTNKAKPGPANMPGAPVDAEFEAVPAPEPLCINAAQVKMISTAVSEYAKSKGREVEGVWKNIKDLYKIESRKLLTGEQMDEILATIKGK